MQAHFALSFFYLSNGRFSGIIKAAQRKEAAGLELFDPVRYLKGVGEARAKQLAGLGIHTVYDLISYFPRAYEDRSRLVTVDQLTLEAPACFRAMVCTAPRTAHIRKGLDITRLSVCDETSRLNLTFFNQKYAVENLHYGEEYYFYGALNGDYTGFSMSNPVFEAADKTGVLTRRIMPIYPLTAGLSNQMIARLVRQALDACLSGLPEVLPAAVRQKYGLADVTFAYENIHSPLSMEAVEQARQRLVFEEFYIFSAGLLLLRQRRTVKCRSAYTDFDLAPFYDALPFCLTHAQKRVIGEILTDFSKDMAMNRMVQGDVGSGKTMVAAAAAYCAAKNGEQAALMAPTELLAEQHARSLTPLLSALGVRCALLTGSMTPARKKEVREALAHHEVDLIIGTHALISESTQFARLGLVIADEQHRFGVAQRAALAAKGSNPHLLVMSATPIPRTLALILYGDLDISVIDELPPGRQRIDTFLVDESFRARINAFIRKQVSLGHQCYIVCPAIEETETGSVHAAQEWADTLQRTVFPELRVALLHGRMKGAEKDALMRAFAAGEYDILVATTVIEVGVDVPNATLMVVENADRFGLSQLHQLRGRVGRGRDKSYCILFSSSQNPETNARLKALCKTNDGFRISEADLSLRGPGDFFGSRQSGLPAFKAGNLTMDLATLKNAQSAAAELVQSQDIQRLPEYAPLLARIRALFSDEDTALN